MIMSTTPPLSLLRRWLSLAGVFAVVGLLLLANACDPTTTGIDAGTEPQQGETVTEVVADTSTNQEPVSETDPSNDAAPSDVPPPRDQPTPDTSPDATPDTTTASNPYCAKSWEEITQAYPAVGTLGACTTPEGKRIAESVFNLANIAIDNQGTKMSPCIEVKCDSTDAYIVTNALPHYDFIQTTPNALTENRYIYRIPLKPTAIAANASADDETQLKGCENAYKQFLTNNQQGTQTEPSGQCTLPRGQAKSYISGSQGGKTTLVHKLACFGAVGFVLSGVPIFGPNEAQIPDPYGNPFVYTPLKAGEPLRGAAAMDMCFAHTAFAMHHHGINEACFEKQANRQPKASYATATSTWDWNKALTETCTKESGIVGWAFDGVPIKGPCVCMKRNADGSCASLKRARSSWSYEGLKSWGNDPNESASLGKEATSCTTDTDCCGNAQGRNCRYRCKPAIVDDKSAPGGTVVGKRCLLIDYSWCGNRFIDRSSQDVSALNFVYLDRCNGVKGADGYAYHATASFPLIVGCFTYQPSNALNRSNALLPRP